MRDRIIQFFRDFDPAFPVRLWKTALVLIASSSLVFPAMIYVGWVRVPPIAFFNGMAVQPKVKAQSLSPLLPAGDGMLRPRPGTVPQGAAAYPYPTDPDRAGLELANPLPVSMQNLKQGQHTFEIFCQPCHGYNGLGDGSAIGVGRLPPPPSLHSGKARMWPDGRLFHVITMGQNRMPSYAYQIEPMDRWAAILYLRVLQRALAPKAGDIPTTTTARPKQKEEAR